MRLLSEYAIPESPALYLPSRYAQQVDAEQRRPFMYVTQDSGRTVIVANAQDIRQRIPLDELKDMAKDVRVKRSRRGDTQQGEEWRKRLIEYYWDRIQWGVDRRNGRMSFGAATFTGSRRG